MMQEIHHRHPLSFVGSVSFLVLASYILIGPIRRTTPQNRLELCFVACLQFT